MLKTEGTYVLFIQVLITGLQHFLTINVKPKLQRVETFIKVTKDCDLIF